ncbi:hypothetical protein [Methylomonas sp. TEB]|uniref:hypothetical protein n=1 Tax=Methylomonas sp. TEB TaxID=3398229 RepID=UPI0039F61FD6
MLLKEIANPNQAIRRLLKDVQFVSNSEENSVIERRLEKKRIKPTPNNIKRYLLRCYMTPLDELPQPERKIVLRLARPDRYE